MCGRSAGWRVLADRARLGRPGSRLPLRTSVAGLGGGISCGGRPPTLVIIFFAQGISDTEGEEKLVRKCIIIIMIIIRDNWPQSHATSLQVVSFIHSFIFVY